uniref:Uncharacterized protein n=1 Tax=viral metagenome TaxID=1070528 RepID=A0A6M3LQ68_9ZZZZ
MIKTEKEIKEKIAKIKEDYHHVLYIGGLSTIEVNAPRALMQISATTMLTTLYWVLGKSFTHKYSKQIDET